MLNVISLLNKLSTTDIIFFVSLAVIIGLCVLIYFLIPVFNRKQYQEQIDNLHAREKAFNAGRAKRDQK